jgi:hypothetical protein
MAKIHFVLHARRSRNDEYKSFVAATIAEHIQQRGQAPFCIDTDLVRPTFSGYKKLAAITLSVMEKGKVDATAFQNLIQLIGKSSVDVVIDFPEASFLTVSQYLGTNHVTEKFRQLGHQLTVHVVTVGGHALTNDVYQTFPLFLQVPCKAAFVVWMKKNLNLFHPENAYNEAPYSEKRKSAAAIVDVPSVEEAGCGFDLTNMMGLKRTFAEAMKPDTRVDIERPRVRYLKSHLFTQLDRIAIL